MTPETFNHLCDSYSKDTMFLSFTKRSHPAYKELLAADTDTVVPFLLKKVDLNNDAPWVLFELLALHTGAQPFSEDDRGIHRAIRESWLRWGRFNGYLNSEDNNMSVAEPAAEPTSELPIGVVSPEKRVYVVVAETVQSGVEYRGNGWALIPNPELSRSTNQVCGRISAQVAHVVSKMQVSRVLYEIEKNKTPLDLLYMYALEPITTIVLTVRDSLELYHIWNILAQSKLDVTDFMDENPKMYGTTDKILTAICTGPINPELLQGLTTHLPLWKHGKATPADL
jgi:peptidyl-tRNA hydrolase